MSNCRRWISISLSVVVLFWVWISSMEKSPNQVVYKAVSPPESQVAMKSTQKLSQPYLLASRSIHLMKYAQYEKMERGKQVAKNAEHFLGAPYQWGGTNPRGFDCSGFTQYVYAEYGGVKVPRNSYDQYNQGNPVSREQLQPGDLVFFTTYAPGPSHLGIYIGDGKFVHALNQQTGVTISKLDADYYKQRFLGARRVL